MCSSGPQPSMARWGHRLLSQKLGLQLQRASNQLVGLGLHWLSTPTRPSLCRREMWSPAPQGLPLPDAPIQGHLLPDPHPLQPLHQCEGSMWKGLSTGTQMPDLQHTWPCSLQQPQGHRLASTFV